MKKTPQLSDESRSEYEPIAVASDDVLGFVASAEFLKDVILSSREGASHVFGIDGPWGSGKSSLLNLLLTKLEQSDDTASAKPVVVHFKPWLVGTREALILNFFRVLTDAISDVAKNEYFILSPKRLKLAFRKARLRNRLSAIARNLSGSGFLTALSLADVVVALFTLIAGLFIRPPTLEDQKEQITKLVSGLLKMREGTKIVVVIDDMDRLDPSEAMEVLRLVKAVANFPSVQYLLAYDRAVLAEAVEIGGQVTDGGAYLEKIIQFNLKVPMPAPFKIRYFLRKKLEAAFPDAAAWDSQRASIVLDYWAGRLVVTPRDVIKIFESVRLMWSNLDGRADLLDLIWVEMLKEKASSGNRDLYSWVLSYVTSLQATAIGGMVSRQKETQDRLVAILSELGWTRSSDDSFGTFQFHHLKELLVGVSESFLPNLERQKDELWIFQDTSFGFKEASFEQRFSSPWHWRLYSGFTQPESALPDEVWNTISNIAENGTDGLNDAIEKTLSFEPTQLFSSTLGDQLLDHVQIHCETASFETRSVWITAIVDTADLLYDHSRNFGFFSQRETERYVRKILMMTLEGATKIQRKALLRKLFVDGASLWALGETFRDQYFVFNPRGDGTSNEPFITEEEFKSLRFHLRARLRSIDGDDFDKAAEGWTIVYTALNAWDDTKAKKWFESLIKEDRDLVLIAKSLEVQKSSSQTEPGVPSSWLRKFTDTNIFKERLKTIANNRSELAHTAQIILDRWYEDRGE